MHHCSTVEQKVQWISQLLVPEPAHGLVSQLSRTHEVSRQTLYRWKEKGAQALEAALEIRQTPPKRTMQVQEQVLTLLIEAHASYRDIQACLMKVCGIRMSLGSISRIVQEAGKRAQQWLSQQQASTPRALALDEQYSSHRGKAYLNVIDVHSGQVWATWPPVAVDGESWTLWCGGIWVSRDSSVSAVSAMEDELFKTHWAKYNDWTAISEMSGMCCMWHPKSKGGVIVRCSSCKTACR
jgi:transposase-like protein